MPECEICGREAEKLYEISVEGATMLVCRKCSRGKDILQEFGGETEEKERAKVDVKSEGLGEEELVENYGEIMRKAREALGLPLKVLAEKISEKASTLLRIEKQKTLPSEKTRKKLEKELGIRLTAKGDIKRRVLETRRSEPVSLWDAAKKKDDKK